MCEEFFAEDDLEYEDDDGDYCTYSLDFSDFMPPKRKPRYLKAEQPMVLADRLKAYKYHKKLQKFTADFSRMLLRPFGDPKAHKRKLLCVYVGGEFFRFLPTQAGYEMSPPQMMEMYGQQVKISSGPSTFKITCGLYDLSPGHVHDKFQNLMKKYYETPVVYVNICGMPFVISSLTYTGNQPDFHGMESQVVFEMMPSHLEGVHQDQRQQQRKIRKVFQEHWANEMNIWLALSERE